MRAEEDAMEVTVIGSGTGVPLVERASPALAVRIEDEVLLFDCGAGTLRKMLEVPIDFKEIDNIYLTHLHPDHTVGLISFLFASKDPRNLRTKPLYIRGGKGLKQFYKDAIALYGKAIEPEDYEIKIDEISEGKLKFASYSISISKVLHTEASVAYRIEPKSGGVFALSGDTDYCSSLVELVKGADLAVLECSFPDGEDAKGHLTPAKIGKIGQEAKPKRIALTHRYPPCDQHDIVADIRKFYDGQVLLAQDLMNIAL